MLEEDSSYLDSLRSLLESQAQSASDIKAAVQTLSTWKAPQDSTVAPGFMVSVTTQLQQLLSAADEQKIVQRRARSFYCTLPPRCLESKRKLSPSAMTYMSPSTYSARVCERNSRRTVRNNTRRGFGEIECYRCGQHLDNPRANSSQGGCGENLGRPRAIEAADDSVWLRLKRHQCKASRKSADAARDYSGLTSCAHSRFLVRQEFKISTL